jgi:hypothetical protein
MVRSLFLQIRIDQKYELSQLECVFFLCNRPNELQAYFFKKIRVLAHIVN